MVNEIKREHRYDETHTSSQRQKTRLDLYNRSVKENRLRDGLPENYTEDELQFLGRGKKDESSFNEKPGRAYATEEINLITDSVKPMEQILNSDNKLKPDTALPLNPLQISNKNREEIIFLEQKFHLFVKRIEQIEQNWAKDSIAVDKRIDLIARCSQEIDERVVKLIEKVKSIEDMTMEMYSDFTKFKLKEKSKTNKPKTPLKKAAKSAK